jgi:hypothetical protein
VIDSPAVKAKPSVWNHTLKIGEFIFNLLCEDSPGFHGSDIVGILRKPLDHSDEDNTSDAPVKEFQGHSIVPENLDGSVDSVCSSALEASRSFLNPNSSAPTYINASIDFHKVINQARSLGSCNRCFSINHQHAGCRVPFRCVACFKYGNTFRFCFTKARPGIFWRPKPTQTSVGVLDWQTYQGDTRGSRFCCGGS